MIFKREGNDVEYSDDESEYDQESFDADDDLLEDAHDHVHGHHENEEDDQEEEDEQDQDEEDYEQDNEEEDGEESHVHYGGKILAQDRQTPYDNQDIDEFEDSVQVIASKIIIRTSVLMMKMSKIHPMTY
jgi:hypothetical protein